MYLRRPDAASGATLLDVPRDILMLVFHGLTMRDMAAAAATNRLMHDAAQCPSLWADLIISCCNLRGGILTEQLRGWLAHCRTLTVEAPAAPCASLDDSAMCLLLQACRPGLTRLVLSGHAHLSATSLLAILHHSAPTLEEVHLRGCCRIATKWADSSVPALPRLRILDLSHTNVSDGMVDALLERSPALELLKLNYVPTISDAALARVGTSQITKLGLIGSERVSDSKLRTLMQALPRGNVLCDISFVADLPEASTVSSPEVEAVRNQAAANAIDKLLAAYYAESGRF